MSKEHWLTFWAAVVVLGLIIASLVIKTKDNNNEWDWYHDE